MRKALIFISFCFVAMIGMNLFAENRQHDQIMKDVNATFAALKMDIDANMAATVQQDATKLEALFKEVELFWTPLRSKTAVQAAKSLESVSEDIAVAARANDLKRANPLYGGLGKTCKTCHDRHRVHMPDKTLKIRP